MQLTWNLTPSSCLVHASTAPTSRSEKCVLASSRLIHFGHQRRLLMSAKANTPFFRNSIIPFKTQNPLSRITSLSGFHNGFVNRKSRPEVFPKSEHYFGGRSLGMSLPSTISIQYNIRVKPQTTVWYSFLNDHGFLWTYMKLGYVYLFRHLDIDLSRHDTQAGMKYVSMFLFHSSMSLLTSQKPSL